jgi:hypothetical protein
MWPHARASCRLCDRLWDTITYDMVASGGNGRWAEWQMGRRADGQIGRWADELQAARQVVRSADRPTEGMAHAAVDASPREEFGEGVIGGRIGLATQ